MNIYIKDACRDIHNNSVSHGFWESEDVHTKLFLILSEIVEAGEAHISGDDLKADINEFLASDGSDAKFALYIKDSFGDKLADAVIRIFDLAEHLNIPLEDHIKWKHTYNVNRPFKHNKQY